MTKTSFASLMSVLAPMAIDEKTTPTTCFV